MKKDINKYIIEKKIKDLLILKHKNFYDHRGLFAEIYKKSEINKLIKNFSIKQINLSISKKNVARGLHLQIKPKMSKMMRVIKGEAIFFAINIKKNNAKKRELYISKFTENDNLHLWAPYYYARGFIALKNSTVVEYLCDAEYNPDQEYSLNIFDKTLKHNYLKKNYKISKKDRNAMSLDNFYKLNIKL